MIASRDSARARAILGQLGVRPRRLRVVGSRRNVHWVVQTTSERVVLRRYAIDRSWDDVAWELGLLERLHDRGWPVAPALTPPFQERDGIWCLFPFLLGRPRSPRTISNLRVEQRERGRLLARLHEDLADLASLGQRPGWLPAHEGLWVRAGRRDPADLLSEFERAHGEPGRVLRVYAERASERLEALLPFAPRPIVIHGDFAPWNLRYGGGVLTGILDFDSSHLDLRVADFALAWRGRHQDVISGYEQEAPLEPVERELVGPVYWAWVVASAVGGLDAGNVTPEGVAWAVEHLLRTDLLQ